MRHHLRGMCRVAVLAALTALACGGDGPGSDSCISGANMTNPRVVAGLETAPGGSTLRITWEPGTSQGAALPSEYFAQVRVYEETAEEVRALIPSVSLTGERELTVRFRTLGPYLDAHGNVLDFSLAFPDRRSFISCSHPGMDDEYLLKVHLQFDAQKQLERAELAEHVSYGDI
jgi:hypothetical protein